MSFLLRELYNYRSVGRHSSGVPGRSTKIAILRACHGNVIGDIISDLIVAEANTEFFEIIFLYAISIINFSEETFTFTQLFFLLRDK